MSLISLKTILIICPLVFLAGLIDAIAGGGALISIPAYLIAGIPIHSAIATNKLSASFGASICAVRFIKKRMINFKLGVPSVVSAIAGSMIGANLSMRIDSAIMMKVLVVILPLTVFVIMNKKIFHDYSCDQLTFEPRTFVIAIMVAFIIGIYDGFFGPGAGTFTIIGFNVFAKMSIKNANAQTKLINFTTTITALIVFLSHGQVMIPLGIAAGICNLLGSFIGSGLAIRKGSTLTKPAMLIVMLLLVIKIAGVY